MSGQQPHRTNTTATDTRNDESTSLTTTDDIDNATINNSSNSNANSVKLAIMKSRKLMYRVLPMLVGALMAFMAHKFIGIRVPRKQPR